MLTADLFAAIVECSDAAIIAKDLDGCVLTWNQAAQNAFGWTAAEMIGQPIRRIIPADRQAEEDEILATIRRGESVDQLETVRLHKDGSLIPIAVLVSPIRDASGTIIGASKIARDISDEVQTRTALRESEARFELMADNITQLAWIGDAEGSLYWYNRRWFDYTGTTLEEMAGWGWEKVHHPDHVDRVVAHVKEGFETGTEWEETFPLRGADGQYRWFLTRAVPLKDEAGKVVCWFGTNTDVSELRDAEQRIEVLMMEVNHTRKICCRWFSRWRGGPLRPVKTSSPGSSGALPRSPPTRMCWCSATGRRCHCAN